LGTPKNAWQEGPTPRTAKAEGVADTTVIVAAITAGSTLLAAAMGSLGLEHFRRRADQENRAWDRHESERQERKALYASIVSLAIRFRLDAKGDRPLDEAEGDAWDAEFAAAFGQVAIVANARTRLSFREVAIVINEVEAGRRPHETRSTRGATQTDPLEIWPQVQARFDDVLQKFVTSAVAEVRVSIPEDDAS
jgi:hypothetical protein